MVDYVVAQADAFIADENGRTGDQLTDLVLAFAAKRAIKRGLRRRVARFG